MLKRIRDLFGRADKASSPEGEPADAPDVELGPEPPVAEALSAAAVVHHGPSAVHRPIALADLDPDAVKILRRLTRFDQTAYLVGGCVRDLLLDRRPKDFDIATSATPRQVKRLFSNCRIIGRRFRLAHIYFQTGKIIEVATFRARDEGDGTEASPEDDLLIRDDNVFGSPEEDSRRRDFTINALFYDVNAETVLDHVDGLGDLRRRLVRTIGDPGIRFREDPIRILRAIKFAARLGFDIEAATLDAIRLQRSEIPKAAPARVLEEINRFCRGGAARASFDLLLETGVFEVILPEIAEGYGEDAEARALLSLLLDRIDGRVRDGYDPTTGEILATLFLPLLAPRFGWRDDGRVTQSGGAVPVRDLADSMLRPISVRLRVARKDQESCRQILMVLSRLAPMKALRRGARESLLRRGGFAESLALLETIAARRGGELAEAAAGWRSIAPRGEELEPRQDSAAEGAESGESAREEAEETPRRRRRRRSRRGGGRAGARRDVATADGAPAAPPSAATLPAAASAKPPSSAQRAPRPAPDRRSDLPSPWDDRYFFAALPSAGPVEAYEDVRDRRAPETEEAEAGGSEPVETAVGTEPEAGATAQAPRRRRRSRSRRGGRGRRAPEGAAPSGNSGTVDS